MHITLQKHRCIKERVMFIILCYLLFTIGEALTIDKKPYRNVNLFRELFYYAYWFCRYHSLVFEVCRNTQSACI